jgi:membrane peptidoglycan carboxypeptidase
MKVSNGNGRNRRSRNTYTTKSGKNIKLNRSISDRRSAAKAARAAAKATYLSTLPKNRYKRILYRLKPKHLAQYWFSREGGIMALKIIGIAVVVGFFTTIGLFAYFRKDLPQIKDISGDNIGGSVTYYDRTGNTVLWQDYSSTKRIPVQTGQISPYMKEATVAIEDKNFYKEGAFDVRGILRAAVNDASGGSTQGGSTITQQLVKLNEGWTNDHTITRKVKELILAVELERQYSKDDILTGYLNVAPYGGVDYGVQAAAEDYFQTSATQLSLAQSAMLAAIPQAPSAYSPYSSTQYNPAVTEDLFDQGALIDRQQYILDLMAKQGYITQAQADAAKQVNVLAQVHPQQSLYQNIQAPYFVQAAKQQLINQFGAATYSHGGWKVITTLDMNLQNHAEQLVASNYPTIQKDTAYLADDEATVGEDVQTGQIVDLVGGVNFNDPTDGQLNFAASELVGPGSTFKPYDYVTLINNNNNVGAGSVMYDQKTPLPGYSGTCPLLPTSTKTCPAGTQQYLYDYDFLNPGPITLRYAIGGSRNVPAVKAMLEAVPGDTSPSYTTSINKVISTASALMDNPYLQAQHQNAYNCYQPGSDISTDGPAQVTQCYASSAIGDGDLHLDDTVNGLASIAREGQAIPRTFIMKITDAAGKTVYNWTQPKPTQAVRTDAAYIVDNMASDPRASYLPGSCSATTCTSLAQGGYKFQRDDNGWDFAVKTGTTDSGFDGLMASWSPHYATISWVGNHTRNVDIEEKTGIAMEYLTEPLTRGMMEYAHQGLKPNNWVQPPDIKVLPAYVQRTHIHFGDEEPGPTDDIFPSWYVGNSNTKATSETLDKVSGGVATSCTPADAKQVVNNANVASWNIDIFVNGGKQNVGSATTGTSINSSTTTDNVHNCNDTPPSVTLTAPATCNGSCTVTATVTQGTHPLSDPQYPNYPGTVAFTLGGQTIKSVNVSTSPSTISFTYNPTSSGSGPLTATVTDSVLYQGSDSATMTYSPTAASTGPTMSSAIQSGNTINFTWSGGTAPFNVFSNLNSTTPVSTSCTGTSSSTCSATTVQTTGATSFFVEDSAGNKSTPVTPISQ